MAWKGKADASVNWISAFLADGCGYVACEYDAECPAPELSTGLFYRTGAIGSSKAGGERQAKRMREHSVAGAFHDRIIIIEMPEKAEDPQDIGVIDGVIDGL